MSSENWMDRLEAGKLHADDIPPSEAYPLGQGSGQKEHSGGRRDRGARQFKSRRHDVGNEAREALREIGQSKAERAGKPATGYGVRKGLENQFLNFDSTKTALSTNRGGDNRQPGNQGPTQTTPLLFRAGEDRAEIVVYVRWDNFERFCGRLEKARSNAEGARALGPDEGCDNIVDDWIVQDHGFRLGGKKGPMIRYLLESDGVEVGIMRAPTYEGTLPNVKVIFGSVALMVYGFAELWKRFVAQVDAWEGTIDKAVVSRVDFCCDLPGEDVGQFVDRFMARWWVSRARGFRTHSMMESYYEEFGRATIEEPTGIDDGAAETTGDDVAVNGTGLRFTGFTLGRGIRIGAYDKLLETQRNDAKRAVMVERRWNGETPESATRVEFQVRRAYLKEFSAHSPDDWIRLRGGVLKYLCEKWFRFTEAAPDVRNGHQERATPWSLWVKITASMLNACETVEPVGRKIEQKIDFKALRQQARGVLATLYACSQFDPSQIFSASIVDDFLGFVAEELCNAGEQLDPEQLLRKVTRKRLEFRASNPQG